MWRHVMSRHVTLRYAKHIIMCLLALKYRVTIVWKFIHRNVICFSWATLLIKYYRPVYTAVIY